LAVLLNVATTLTRGSSSSQSIDGQKDAVKLDPKKIALQNVKLDKFEWKKGGFDNVMLFSATVKNEGGFSVKDLEIECSLMSKSGTKIGSKSKTIFEIVKAGKTLKIKDFNMGLVNTQSASTSCEITDLVLL
jgi:hypothetical protein